MNEPTRQQRRTHERQRQAHIARLAKGGLTPTRDMFPTVVLTAQLAQILSAASDRRRATKAARAAHRVFDLSLKKTPPNPGVACAAGCAYCCRGFVSASAPEVLLVADRMAAETGRGDGAIIARLVAADEATRGLDGGARHRLARPCPMLEDDLCAVYAARPTACRGHASRAVDACIAWLGDRDASIPVPEIQVHYNGRCQTALLAALKSVGLPHHSYELNHALRVALDTENAEARWLAGEDVFEGVQTDPSRSAEAEATLDRLGDAARRADTFQRPLG